MLPNGIVYEAKDGLRPNTKEIYFKFIIETDNDLIKKSDLGKTNQICRVCNDNGKFQTWNVFEMLTGCSDDFKYFICPECLTLQIDNYPSNDLKYYEHDTYRYKRPDIAPVTPGVPIDKRMILEIGCGSGAWLCNLASYCGCVNVYGCDEHILDGDIIYPNGVKLYKKTLHELEGEYDVIMLNNSINRYQNPHAVFKTLRRLLKPPSMQKNVEEPKIQIITQRFPNVAWDIFKSYWWQINPPRHYYLYSEKSIKYLAKLYGLYVSDSKPVDTSLPMFVSRQYQMGYIYNDIQKAFADNYAYDFIDTQIAINYFRILSETAKLTGENDMVEYTLVNE